MTEIPNPQGPHQIESGHRRRGIIHVNTSYELGDGVYVAIIQPSGASGGVNLSLEETKDLITALQWRVAWVEQTIDYKKKAGQ